MLYGNKGPQIRAKGVPNWELFFSRDTQWVKTLGITPRYPLGIIAGGGGGRGEKGGRWKKNSVEKWLKFARFRIKKSSKSPEIYDNFQKVPKNICSRILFFFFFFWLAFISNICSQIWLNYFLDEFHHFLVTPQNPWKKPWKGLLWHGQTSGNFGAKWTHNTQFTNVGVEQAKQIRREFEFWGWAPTYRKSNNINFHISPPPPGHSPHFLKINKTLPCSVT